jgi:hypothetical protein
MLKKYIIPGVVIALFIGTLIAATGSDIWEIF